MRRFLNAPSVDEIIFTRNATEAHQPRRQLVRRHGLPARATRSSLSIMEHHSNIVPWHFHRERKGCRPQVGADRRRRRVPARRVRAAADPAHQDGRHHAHVERAGHRRADQGGRAHRARARHPGAGRRQPGRRAHARRRAGPRLRLLRLHRPQDLRSHRHRRALRQEEAPRRHAALHGRRRDDRERAHRRASPTARRRTSSRPARRRSCRRSGWAPRSTT